MAALRLIILRKCWSKAASKTAGLGGRNRNNWFYCITRKPDPTSYSGHITGSTSADSPPLHTKNLPPRTWFCLVSHHKSSTSFTPPNSPLACHPKASTKCKNPSPAKSANTAPKDPKHCTRTRVTQPGSSALRPVIQRWPTNSGARPNPANRISLGWRTFTLSRCRILSGFGAMRICVGRWSSMLGGVMLR